MIPLTLVMTLVLGGVALAADLKADLVVGGGFDTSVNVGPQAAGPHTHPARLSVNGGGAQVYPFTVTASGASGAITGATSVNIESATGADSTISYTVPCLASGGAFSGQITFTAPTTSGLDNRTVTVTISGTASPCGPTNTAPTLTWTAGPTSVNESGTAQHTYAFSITDPDANTWTFAAGSPSCGTGGALVLGSDSIDQTAKTGSFKCIFDDGLATPSVSAQVSDGTATSSAISQSVTVANVAPTATLNSASSVTTLSGRIVNFDFSATDPSNADSAAGFEWRFDNGLGGGYGLYGSAQTTAFRPSATYSTCGSFTAKAQAMDKDDGESNEPSIAIAVYDGDFHGAIIPAQRNLVQKGRVIPVQIRIGCDGTALTGLNPTIMLATGDVAEDVDSSDPAVLTPTTVSSADQTGVMRPNDGGYIYNLQIPNTASAGQKYTILVKPWGSAGPTLKALVEIRK